MYSGKMPEIIFPAFLLLATFSTSSQSWKPNPAALMTPWSEQINPQNVLPEYPRPTMERSEWQNLNGVWQFQKAKNGAQIIDNDLNSVRYEEEIASLKKRISLL